MIGADGYTYQKVATALSRSHRHKPMTHLLHTPPPPDRFCVANKIAGYVVDWAQSEGVLVQPLPPDWPARAADLVEGVIDFGGRPIIPGVKIWRPYR